MASELYGRLMDDLKCAMKAHETVRVNAIRGVIAKAKDLTVNAGKEMDDESVLSVIAKGVKQREESIAQFEAAGRAELAANERIASSISTRNSDKAPLHRFSPAAISILEKTTVSPWCQSVSSIKQVLPSQLHSHPLQT